MSYWIRSVLTYTTAYDEIIIFSSSIQLNSDQNHSAFCVALPFDRMACTSCCAHTKICFFILLLLLVLVAMGLVAVHLLEEYAQLQ